jgi:hypothetical protein
MEILRAITGVIGEKVQISLLPNCELNGLECFELMILP